MTLLANAITSPCMDDNTADPPFDLAASANAFRSLFENAGICMARLDSALAVREVNAEFCQALGWTAVEARDGTARGGAPRQDVAHRATASVLTPDRPGWSPRRRGRKSVV